MENIADFACPPQAVASATVLPLASSRHTKVFVAIVFGLAAMGAVSTAFSSASAAPPSASILLGAYGFMIFAQLMWLRFIQRAMRQQGHSVHAFFGPAWSLAQLGADVLYAALACALVFAISAGMSVLLPDAQPQLKGLAPTGLAGYALWLCMAITAGACEEVAFRGYFPRQLGVLAAKPWLAVLGQAALFGIAHSYQGMSATLVIMVTGLVLGLLAAWRGNIRACILAHAAVDILAGVLGYYVSRSPAPN